MSGQKDETLQEVLHELIDTFDEYVVCMVFATKGIEEHGEKLASDSFSKADQVWIGSKLDSNPKMHARIKTVECIEKCREESGFSNEIRKSLLCTMYSLWDELYRHRVAAACNMEAKDLICPLMGDMRKIRHCIIHQKSIVPEDGISFEVLDWQLSPGRLVITHEHFLDFNDAVRSERMNIHSFTLSPEMEEIFKSMTQKERRRFEEFFKIRGNKENDVEWPGLEKVISRIEKEKSKKSESEAQQAAAMGCQTCHSNCCAITYRFASQLCWALCSKEDVVARIEPSRRIYISAKQFHEAAELIWEQSDDSVENYIYPLIVNYALSCELSLKACESTVSSVSVSEKALPITAEIKSEIWGHKLSQLFKNLSEPNREKLNEGFLSTAGKELQPLLEECESYFIKARYAWEKGNSGIYYLSGVRELSSGLIAVVPTLGPGSA